MAGVLGRTRGLSLYRSYRVRDASWSGTWVTTCGIGGSKNVTCGSDWAIRTGWWSPGTELAQGRIRSVAWHSSRRRRDYNKPNSDELMASSPGLYCLCPLVSNQLTTSGPGAPLRLCLLLATWAATRLLDSPGLHPAGPLVLQLDSLDPLDPECCASDPMHFLCIQHGKLQTILFVPQ